MSNKISLERNSTPDRPMDPTEQATHTPGPWESHALLSGSENAKGFRVTAFDGRDGRTWIADTSPVIDSDNGDASEQGKANARLIAAAPELLEACKAVLQIWFPSDQDKIADTVQGLLQWAIAKAEGK